MALSNRSLVRLTSAPVGLASGAIKNDMVSVFLYGTDDAAAVVEAAGYFNNQRTTLRKGDIILASMVHGGTSVLKPYVVLTVPATGNVTIGLGSVTAG